ncbi:MAG: type I restriction enzyme S subunit [Cyclobacteriaceae bacterium]|jgi:type I restriction enzyme S subunit
MGEEVVNPNKSMIVTNEPSLRFRESSGEWVKKKVGEICDFIVPGRNKPQDFNGDIPWITTPDIQHNSTVLYSKNGLAISKEEAKSVGSKIVPKNSIIISCVGELGLTAIAGTDMVINQQLHAFIPNEKSNNRFLLYSIGKQKKYMDRVATKTAVPYMNKDNCNAIPIYLPTLPEQQKIASFLTAVDTKIAQLTEKKTLLEQYKKGVMQKIFSREIRFKPTPNDPTYSAGKYPDWEEKKLGEVSEINPKNSALPKSFIYIDLESVDKGDLVKETQINKSEAPSRAQRILSKNDVLYQMVRPYQMNNYHFKSDGNYVASTGYAQLRVKRNASFIFQLIHTEEFVNNVLERCTGTSYPAINPTDLGKINISIPCHEEQTQIANFLSAIDDKIKLVSTQLEKTQGFKKGLLQQMFV